MNATKYAVRFYDVSTRDGEQYLEQTREVQVHKLINAVVLLSGPAGTIYQGPTPRIAKFFIKERGRYRELRPSDWQDEVHDKARISELGLPEPHIS